MTGARPSWADGWRGPVILALLVAVVFGRSLGGDFIWDDHRFITDNPSVTSPASWTAFFTDPTTADTFGARGIFRPLRTFEFALDHALFGLSPLAFRVHSLLWHVAAAVALLFVLRRLLPDARAALLAAAFWAVHPVQAESVAFVSSRGDVAMGALCLVSILFAFRSNGWDRDLAISLAAGAIACLYKETAVALPLAIVALRLTRQSRAPWWPHFLVAGLFLVYRGTVQTGDGGHGAGFVLGGSTAGTIATMIRAGGWYVCEMLLPAQSVDWYLPPSRSFAEFGVLAWLAAFAALAVVCVRTMRTHLLWTLAFALFVTFLLPVSNWPLFLGIPTAERFLYLPLGGAALAFGAAMAAPRLRSAGLLVVGVLAATTIYRATMWTSDDAFWNAVTLDHDSPRALDTIARRRRLEGIALRDAAVALPDGPAKVERMAEARRVLERALDRAHAAIGFWRRYEATDHPSSTLAAGPEVTAANVCYILGRDAEALGHAEEAIRIRPDDRLARYNRAKALLQLGFAPQAIAEMRQAVARGMDAGDPDLQRFFDSAAAAAAALTDSRDLDEKLAAVPRACPAVPK